MAIMTAGQFSELFGATDPNTEVHVNDDIAVSLEQKADGTQYFILDLIDNMRKPNQSNN